MRIVKRLDLFLLSSFLPLFFMTFGICLFIFLMQFLWMYVDEMVGKGIEIHILLQLFYYAAMKLVPQALPLAILFASLMTFGNLGEQFELLALKASGISLIRIMRSLIVFLLCVSVLAFYFQDNIIPISQVKFYTILFSVRQKSPELEIPEKSFYSGIPGKNIYVREKDKKRKLLKDVRIFDYSDGFNNARVIVADSGRLKTSTDKLYLILTLYNGESFENIKDDKSRTREAKDAVPFRRDTFAEMEMLMFFDSNFNMRDEGMYKDRHIGKNLAALRQSIDSMTVRVDSIKEIESKALYDQSYKRTLARYEPAPTLPVPDIENMPAKIVYRFDSLYRSRNDNTKHDLLSQVKRDIERLQWDYGVKTSELRYEDKEIRWHHAEMHRKFTLSIACLIFFFIGAPLGAIIRKGGLGAPAVLSVFLFIVYYIIDTFGYKFARDAIWLPWQGMWLSSAVLFPLGVFLTYKAVNDSVLFSAETYMDAFKRLTGKREIRKIEKKEIILERPDYNEVTSLLQQLKAACLSYLAHNKLWHNYYRFCKSGGRDSEASQIANRLEELVEILKNSDRNIVLNKTMDFPYINHYQISIPRLNETAGIILAIIFPIGGLFYLIATYHRKLLFQDLQTTIKVSEEMKAIVINS